MNCLGKQNYVYFVSLMASLGLLLSYGAYLAYVLLKKIIRSEGISTFDGTEGRGIWEKDRTWSEIFSLWAWAFSHSARIGGVGMLALLTAPLAWGLFVYHIYLIWAGMTTNESSKWADWRDDVTDDLVFKADRTAADHGIMQADTEIEPFVDWPVSSMQRLISFRNGQPPGIQSTNVLDQNSPLPADERSSQQQHWKRVQSLAEIDNIYDLGFEDNLRDVLPT